MDGWGEVECGGRRGGPAALREWLVARSLTVKNRKNLLKRPRGWCVTV